MKITVIVATHKKYRMPHEKCYLPLHVGRGIGRDIGFAGDDTGESISWKNPYYCELTGLYWMWKNVDSDYMGLVQYRRYFAGKQKGRSGDRFTRILSEKEMRGLLRDNDIILPKKRKYYIESLYTHYAHTHYAEHLDCTREILEKKYPEYVSSFDLVMKRTYGHMFNMFIMSREKCDEYCRWLFDVLEELERKIDYKDYDPFQARLFGRVSELLMDVWIEKNGYAYREVPVINMEKINWKNKVFSFLKAKFSGKKYDTSF